MNNSPDYLTKFGNSNIIKTIVNDNMKTLNEDTSMKETVNNDEIMTNQSDTIRTLIDEYELVYNEWKKLDTKKKNLREQIKKQTTKYMSCDVKSRYNTVWRCLQEIVDRKPVVKNHALLTEHVSPYILKRCIEDKKFIDRFRIMKVNDIDKHEE